MGFQLWRLISLLLHCPSKSFKWHMSLQRRVGMLSAHSLVQIRSSVWLVHPLNPSRARTEKHASNKEASCTCKGVRRVSRRKQPSASGANFTSAPASAAASPLSTTSPAAASASASRICAKGARAPAAVVGGSPIKNSHRWLPAPGGLPSVPPPTWNAHTLPHPTVTCNNRLSKMIFTAAGTSRHAGQEGTQHNSFTCITWFRSIKYDLQDASQ